VGAHRGGARLWPENSLLAFRNALGLGVDYVETDVHLTADGTVVLIHDPTLDRTTTGRGPVGAATLADLAPLRLRGLDGSATEERVPTLASLLELLAPTRTDLLLEVKVAANHARYPGIEERVLEVLRAAGFAPRVLAMAFERETVARFRALDPAIRTALLIGRGQVIRGGVPAATSLAWAVEVGAVAVGLDHRLLDAGVVAAARAAGLGIAAWTVDSERDLRRVIDLGVDVVISDRPDVARRLLRD
jgi:glycerophosphoryl diester phosphodiesterase